MEYRLNYLILTTESHLLLLAKIALWLVLCGCWTAGAIHLRKEGCLPLSEETGPSHCQEPSLRLSGQTRLAAEGGRGRER